MHNAVIYQIPPTEIVDLLLAKPKNSCKMLEEGYQAFFV